MSRPLLTVRSVAKRFGATQALACVDLDLHGGEILALMGANGAGKSTLVGIVSGTIAADEGALRLADGLYAPASAADGRRAGVITVHQSTDRVAAPEQTVADALLLDRMADGRAPLFLSRRSVRRHAAAIADRIGLDLDLDGPFGALRPAGRQLVAIARAISADARVLILDEPTASLTSAESERLLGLLDRLKAQGLAILYISHRLADLRRVADRVAVLRGGRVAGLFDRPVDFEAATTAMIGRPLASARPSAPPTGAVASAPVFSARGLRLVPGARPIDLDIGEGEVVAVTGPLGAGKSRLLAVLFGAARAANAGTLLLDARPFAPATPAEAIRAGVAFAGEDRHLTSFVPADWPGGTVSGTIALPHLRRWFPAGWIRPSVETEAAKAAIRRLGIMAAGPHARLDTLSGGNQQKVVLARWQAEPTRLLLLDEPFQGVDVGARADIIAAIRAGRSGATLIATSDPEEAMEVADRILVMDRHALRPWRAGDTPGEIAA